MVRSTRSRLALAAVVAVAATGVVATTGSGQAPDPGGVARFVLSIDGQPVGTFSELALMTSEVKPFDYSTTESKSVIIKRLPGKATPVSLTLVRGLTGDTTFDTWHRAV